MNALVELALAVTEENETTGVSDMVKKALEKHRSEREEAAANDIVALLRTIEQHKQQQRATIRRLKGELSRAKAGLDDLDRRWAFAQKTNNFLPVLAFFNRVQRHQLANPDDFDTLTSVPKDFEVEDF